MLLYQARDDLRKKIQSYKALRLSQVSGDVFTSIPLAFCCSIPTLFERNRSVAIPSTESSSSNKMLLSYLPYLSTLPLLALAAPSSSYLPPCNQIDRPCKCPQGTTFKNLTSFGIIGAPALQVQNIMDHCTPPPYSPKPTSLHTSNQNLFATSLSNPMAGRNYGSEFHRKRRRGWRYALVQFHGPRRSSWRILPDQRGGKETKALFP